MLIDPFVVVAQIINFLILVALLKRFLYQPITQAMSARSQRIESQLAAAASKEKDAEMAKELYQQKQQQLDAQKQQWLNQARQEVEQEKAKLTQQAQTEVNILRSQWQQNFAQDGQKLIRQIRDRLSQQISLTTRKALSDLANANLETQIIATFIDRLYNLSEDQLLKIRSLPVPSSDDVINIRSSFAISQDQKNSLIAAIREQIADQAQVNFTISKDFICGIELRHCGYKISWNLEHYLTELETATATALAENN